MAKLFASEGAKMRWRKCTKGRAGVVDEINKSAKSDVVLATLPNRAMCATWSKGRREIWRHRHLVKSALTTTRIFSTAREEFDKVIAVSLKGPYLVTKYVASNAPTRAGGKNVNFGFDLGHESGASTHRLCCGQGRRHQHDARPRGLQLARIKIRVNCVVPNRSGSPVGFDDDVAGSRNL